MVTHGSLRVSFLLTISESNSLEEHFKVNLKGEVNITSKVKWGFIPCSPLFKLRFMSHQAMMLM